MNKLSTPHHGIEIFRRYSEISTLIEPVKRTRLEVLTVLVEWQWPRWWCRNLGWSAFNCLMGTKSVSRRSGGLECVSDWEQTVEYPSLVHCQNDLKRRRGKRTCLLRFRTLELFHCCQRWRLDQPFLGCLCRTHDTPLWDSKRRLQRTKVRRIRTPLCLLRLSAAASPFKRSSQRSKPWVSRWWLLGKRKMVTRRKKVTHTKKKVTSRQRERCTFLSHHERASRQYEISEKSISYSRVSLLVAHIRDIGINRECSSSWTR